MALPSPTAAPQILKGQTRRGVGKWIWFPTVASWPAPTTAEMSAGTDYTLQIASLDGFAPDSSTVDFGNAGSVIIPTIPGTTSLGSGTIGFNLSKDPAVSDARSVFTDTLSGSAAAGYWADCPNGLVTSGKMKLYAATVQSAATSTGLDDVLTLQVVFALSAVSGFIAIPTA